MHRKDGLPKIKGKRKTPARTAAQAELFGTGNPDDGHTREIVKALSKIKREYDEIEYSYVKVVRGY